jgi:hypothetical protein
MQLADMQLSGDEPLLLRSYLEASKQRRSASLVAHLVLLHGKAEKIRDAIGSEIAILAPG